MGIALAGRAVVLLAPSDDGAGLPWSDQMLGDFAGVLASALGDATIALGVLQVLRGHRASIGDAMAGLRSIVPVTVVTFICGLPWMLLTVVDAVWVSEDYPASLLRWLVAHAIAMVLYARWAIATQANVIERLGALAGLARAAGLTKGRRWGGFGVTIIPLIVVYALYFGSSMVREISALYLDAADAATLKSAADYVISALSSAYFVVQTTVLYYYLRREKEGADSGEIARVFD
jgi:hypothetical protein